MKNVHGVTKQLILTKQNRWDNLQGNLKWMASGYKSHNRYLPTGSWTSSLLSKKKKSTHLLFYDPTCFTFYLLVPRDVLFFSFVPANFCLTLSCLPCNLCHTLADSCSVPWPCPCSFRSELLELLPDPDSCSGFIFVLELLARGLPGSLLWELGAVSAWLRSLISIHKPLIDSIFPEVESMSQFWTWRFCMVSKCPECILLFHVIITLQHAAGYLNPMQIAWKM